MSDEQSPLDGYIAAVDERIRRLEKLAPAKEEQPRNLPEPQPELNCPLCGQKMQRGLVSVHGTFLGFMTVGFSHQQCWFQAWGSDAEEEIIPSGHAKKGWRCHDCGFVGIGIGEARPARKSIGDL